METSKSAARHGEWLLTKKFWIKEKDKVSYLPLTLALGHPRKLRESEKNPALPNHGYGCAIQTGRAITRHIVYGQDAFSALAHAILAWEQFLSSKSKDCEIYEPDGKRFDSTSSLVLLGPIGHRYMLEKG